MLLVARIWFCCRSSISARAIREENCEQAFWMLFRDLRCEPALKSFECVTRPEVTL